MVEEQKVMDQDYFLRTSLSLAFKSLFKYTVFCICWNKEFQCNPSKAFVFLLIFSVDNPQGRGVSDSDSEGAFASDSACIIKQSRTEESCVQIQSVQHHKAQKGKANGISYCLEEKREKLAVTCNFYFPPSIFPSSLLLVFPSQSPNFISTKIKCTQRLNSQ